MNIQEVDNIALKFEYEKIDHQTNISLVSYSKDYVRINVYLTTMTVGTCLNHPKKGKTQLFRKNVDKQTLEQIFENPRKHTGKGYYNKKQ